MGNDRYLIVTTVSNSLVFGIDAEEEQAVLAYAVYDKKTESYVTAEDGKIFNSFEPKDHVGDSINFHPTITEAGSGRYVITWNSIVLGNGEKLSLSNVRSGIKTVIYDSNTGKMVYKSLITEDNNSNLMTGVALKAAYDPATDEVILLYRVANHSKLNEDSTLAEYLNAGSKLMYTSMNVTEAMTDSEVTYEEGVVIAEGGRTDGIANVIKTASLSVMNDNGKTVPVIAYHMTKGENASLISNAEEGSTNHIYLNKLTHTGNTGYEVAGVREVTEAYSEEYHSQPQLLAADILGQKQNILMWKQSDKVTTIDPIAFLNYEDDYETKYQAALMNENAGGLEDLKLLTGADGTLYAMWTEGGNEGNRLMISALGEDGETEGNVRWGHGTCVYETTGKNYIQNFTATVSEDGKLLIIARETVISGDERDGESRLTFHNVDTKANIEVVNYSELSDEELAEFERNQNLEIYVSNRHPKAGETISIVGRVKNSGIKMLEEQNVQLYANGEPVEGAVATVYGLGAGEETEVEFTYQVPDDFASGTEEVNFSLSRGSQRSQTISSGAVLDIVSTTYEQMDYVDAETESTFKVQVTVQNSGNAPSDTTYLMISQLESGKDEDGSFLMNEKLLMDEPVEVSFLEPEESTTVEFELTLPAGYFSGNTLNIAEVGVALYENYGTESQTILEALKDYVKAEEIPQARTLSAANTKKVGVGQSLNIAAKITPEIAQIHTKIHYESLDDAIAKIDENGILTGLKEGTCTIRLRTDNGLTHNIQIEVTKEAVEEEIPDEDLPGGNTGGDSNGNGKVDTGDHSDWYLWIVLMSASVVAAGYALIAAKKRNIKE